MLQPLNNWQEECQCVDPMTMGISCIHNVKQRLYSSLPYEIEDFHPQWILEQAVLQEIQGPHPPNTSARDQLTEEFTRSTANMSDAELMRMREVMREQQIRIRQQFAEPAVGNRARLSSSRGRGRRTHRCGIFDQEGHNRTTCPRNYM
ncbi:hypothetical protein GEMRC1_010529 [Eukaryota sp. GEM-RC1]